MYCTNVYHLDTPLLGLPLHVDFDSQLALERNHLLVHATDLLDDSVLGKVASQVGQELAHLVQPVIGGRAGRRLKAVVREVQTGQDVLEAIPGHDSGHHVVSQ